MKCHYYEAHVIVYVAKSDLIDGVVRHAAKAHGFWCSQITHDDGDEDEVGDVIVTTRDVKRRRLMQRVNDIALDFNNSEGCFVRRAKIEAAVIDSNYGDSLGVQA